MSEMTVVTPVSQQRLSRKTLPRCHEHVGPYNTPLLLGTGWLRSTLYRMVLASDSDLYTDIIDSARRE